MAVNVRLSMAGQRSGDVLLLFPTIVISCAHKRAKARIEQLVGSGQLEFLRELACPSLVCIQGREPRHRDWFFADTEPCEEIDSFRDASLSGLSSYRQRFLSFAVEQVAGLGSVCGLRINFVYSDRDENSEDDLQNRSLNYERRMMARIGGIIYIGEEAFALTTAHTFLFQEHSGMNDVSDNNDTMSDEDFDRELSGQDNYDADSAVDAIYYNQKAIRTKTTKWREMGHLHGSFAFCDHGRRFDWQDFVSLKSPNSDWCTLSVDFENSLSNSYSVENKNGETVEIIVDEIGTQEFAESGDVCILDSPQKPMHAYMTQIAGSIYFGEKSMIIRRLISDCPLSPSLSGCWVVRGKQLLGHIIGGNEFEKTMYMVGIQETKRAVEELTGGNMSLDSSSEMDLSEEDSFSIDLSNLQFEDLVSLPKALKAIEAADNTEQSDSAAANIRTHVHNAGSRFDPINASTRVHRSSSKANTSSAIEVQPSLYNQPWPPRSFLFAVNELPINDNLDNGGTIPLATNLGRWYPPLYSNGFKQQPPGSLYRWEEGTISRAQEYPLSDGAFRTGTNSKTPISLYRNQTLFWCNSFDQFLTVPDDASTYDVADEASLGGHWWSPSFRHEESLSRVEVSGAEGHLGCHGLRWITGLGLETYTNEDTPQHGGLSGNLAILIGLVAFSCRSRDLSTVLVADQAWRDFHWRGHQRGHGRRDQRGVVVNVYHDPANPQGSTQGVLYALEWTGSALLR